MTRRLTIGRRSLAFVSLLVATPLLWIATPGVSSAGPAPSPSSIRINVKFRANTDIGSAASRLGLSDLQPVLRSRRIYRANMAVSGKDATDPKADRRVLERVMRDQSVDYAETADGGGPQDERFYAWVEGRSDFVGTDPAAWQQQPAMTLIGGPQAQQRTRGTGVVVAVLDTGIDSTHPSLAGRMIGGYDYIDDDADPADVGNGIDDDGNGVVDHAVGHGTFVSGIVGLVAPDARIWVGRVLDSEGRGTAPAIAEAIRDATAAGVGVINMSFGTNTKLESPTLDAAIRDAKAAGVIVVAAAGNDSSKSAFWPAAVSGVISVGAVRSDAPSMSPFSNFGKWVDVAAPGERIVSTTPGGSFSAWSGTSAAAPFVAGQAALLRSINPRDRGDRIIETIRKTSRKLDKPFENLLGAGVIDIPASLAK
jgi:subtilisin family serine protease